VEERDELLKQQIKTFRGILIDPDDLVMESRMLLLGISAALFLVVNVTYGMLSGQINGAPKWLILIGCILLLISLSWSYLFFKAALRVRFWFRRAKIAAEREDLEDLCEANSILLVFTAQDKSLIWGSKGKINILSKQEVYTTALLYSAIILAMLGMILSLG
jgi:hypothetical protein